MSEQTEPTNSNLKQMLLYIACVCACGYDEFDVLHCVVVVADRWFKYNNEKIP